jgi:glycolate oxidase
MGDLLLEYVGVPLPALPDLIEGIEAIGVERDIVCAVVAHAGGTITGEHGVGRLKKAWLPDHVGDDLMELTRRIKYAPDLQNILNPGAVI